MKIVDITNIREMQIKAIDRCHIETVTTLIIRAKCLVAKENKVLVLALLLWNKTKQNKKILSYLGGRALKGHGWRPVW
jgi:hypothetical protein